jgi:glycine cleavage system transcriptional repressor
LNINIENLQSEITISPESGTVLYIMEILISIPESISIEELDRGLSSVGEELNVEIIRNKVGN